MARKRTRSDSHSPHVSTGTASPSPPTLVPASKSAEGYRIVSALSPQSEESDFAFVNKLLCFCSNDNILIPGSDFGSGINPAIIGAAKCGAGDFSTSDVLQAFKRRPQAILPKSSYSSHRKIIINNPNVKEFVAFVGQINSFIQKDLFISSINRLISILIELIENNLTTVRFISTLILVNIYPSIVSTDRTALSGRVLEAILSRIRDVNEINRKLSTIDGILRFYFEFNLNINSINQIITNCLNDENLSKWFLIYLNNNSNFLNKIQNSPEIGEVFTRLCFNGKTAIRALSILSTRFGESILSDFHFQLISNLIWKNFTKKKKMMKRKNSSPRGDDENVITMFTSDDEPDGDSDHSNYSIPIAVLKFINEHIFPSPGIIDSETDPEQCVMVIIEFIEQYTDGFVYELNFNFIYSFFRLIKNNYLKNFEILNEILINFINSNNSNYLNILIELIFSITFLLNNTEKIEIHKNKGFLSNLLKSCQIESLPNRRPNPAIVEGIVGELFNRGLEAGNCEFLSTQVE
jgi:hypothetical protein